MTITKHTFAYVHISRSEASCGAVCLGIISLFLGFLLGVIYFAIRSITTSLQNTEVVPTYAIAFLLLSSG